MPAPPETLRNKPDPAGRDVVQWKSPAQISALQAEVDALRRENEELRLANAEQRKNKEALRQEKDRVGAILSALDTGQSLIDPDMTIVWVNQKARDMASCPGAMSTRRPVTWLPGRIPSARNVTTTLSG